MKNNDSILIVFFVLILAASFSCSKPNRNNTQQEKVFHKQGYDSVVTFYDTKNIKETFTIKDGLMDGKYIMYYDTAPLEKAKFINYNNGLVDGKYINYFKSGGINLYEEYSMGRAKRRVIFIGSDTLAVLKCKSSVTEYLNNKPYLLHDTLDR